MQQIDKVGVALSRQKTVKSRLSGFGWRSLKQRFYRLIEHQKLEIKKDPRGFALGCTVGLVVNFFPTMGLGFLLAFYLASLLRANKVCAPAFSLLTGPLIPLKYALNLLVGGLIQASETENFFEFITRQYALIFKIGGIREKLLSFLDFFGFTFVLGAVINAAIIGIGFYYLIRYLTVKKYRNVKN